ncbi:DUF4238 domain-containing protein [Sphingomonas echinoides]|uniref:DUF4238 domain-containing protein n=1 Tax=Sphingomonas echinoides TaxID=59803 RepID=A0ABU4PPN4_9SPHN|nr:DUF4238 domain-containing protein [Sphingomonas echinoides]MDX5985585.1 DUF4238 domain-containing protein [Sphingomonas echinoides]
MPQFYLKRWAGQDQRLERYTRPTPNKITVRRSFPSETGFEVNLYKSPAEKSKSPQWFETEFLQHLDNHTALVFEKLNASPPLNLDEEEHSILSVFVRSMTYRSPEMLAALKNSGAREWQKVVDSIEGIYDTIKSSKDPKTYKDFIESVNAKNIESSVINIFPRLFTSEKVGQVLNNLPKRLIDTPDHTPEFLISDDPLIRTNGILVENGHFALPISPRRLLVMAWKTKTLDVISQQSPTELVTNVNRWIVESARHFVGARDRSQDRFIRNRFGSDPKPPISR